MIGRRYANACEYYGGKWAVAVHDERGWCYMCEYDDARQDYKTCTFNTQEEAEKAAEEYTEFWKEN